MNEIWLIKWNNTIVTYKHYATEITNLFLTIFQPERLILLHTRSNSAIYYRITLCVCLSEPEPGDQFHMKGTSPNNNIMKKKIHEVTS